MPVSQGPALVFFRQRTTEPGTAPSPNIGSTTSGPWVAISRQADRAPNGVDRSMLAITVLVDGAARPAGEPSATTPAAIARPAIRHCGQKTPHIRGCRFDTERLDTQSVRPT